jgi:hypothetical protein
MVDPWTQDAAEARPLHPRRGPHAPSGLTPARRPGSLRRTSTVDQAWPNGWQAPFTLRGRARDLLTPAAGAARVLRAAALTMAIDYGKGRRIVAVDSRPAEPALEALVGEKALSGFRAVVARVVPAHCDSRSPLHMLLDEVPVAALVAGYAMQHAGLLAQAVPDKRVFQNPNLCAGWEEGGTIMAGIEEDGLPPLVTGPPAPPLLPPDDPLSWHEMDDMPANSMRRHRRLDLVAGDGLEVDVFFRDSHRAADGHQTVVHEYVVTARLEPVTLRILEIDAEPRALPWVECPAAAASPRRLIGQTVHDLRARVRSEFTGVSTCTHLNDTLRSLEDIAALAEDLPQAV